MAVDVGLPEIALWASRRGRHDRRSSWQTRPTTRSGSTPCRRSSGTVETCHTATSSYLGKDPTLACSAQCRSASTPANGNGWSYDGDGLKLMNEVRRSPATPAPRRAVGFARESRNRRFQGTSNSASRLCRTAGPEARRGTAADRLWRHLRPRVRSRLLIGSATCKEGWQRTFHQGGSNDRRGSKIPAHAVTLEQFRGITF